jgi:hypothetical protein
MPMPYVMAAMIAAHANRRCLRRICNRVRIDAQDTLDTADHAADGRAHNRAYRSGDTAALLKAMGSAARYALCLRGQRHRHNRQQRAGKQYSLAHRSRPLDEMRSQRSATMKAA